MANVKVADESGCLEIRLREKQLDGLKEGQVIELRNINVGVRNAHLYIELDPWGKIIKETELKVGQVNLENDKSQQKFKEVDEED